MNFGDFSLTCGQFDCGNEKAFDQKLRDGSYRYTKAAAHCKAKEVTTDSDFFGLKLDVISTIKEKYLPAPPRNLENPQALQSYKPNAEAYLATSLCPQGSKAKRAS